VDAAGIERVEWGKQPANRRSYLRSFPFDKIKIGRSFVKDLVERTDCVAIVDAISGLGRRLNT